MPSSQYVQRMVNLEPRNYRLVRKVALEKGLGKKGFSAAIRLILREWAALQPAAPKIPPPPPSS
jgi:hypothetical protein